MVIGEDSIINASTIGSYVYIGKNCVIVSQCCQSPPHPLTPSHPPQSRSCILKDCCKVADNAVLPPETVVPPFSIFTGSPGVLYRIYGSVSMM